MATVSIVQWRIDAVGFTGWDSHAKSELSKRLRRSVNASPAAIRKLERQIAARQLAVVEGVREDEVASVRQILESLGADVLATPGASS